MPEYTWALITLSASRRMFLIRIYHHVLWDGSQQLNSNIAYQDVMLHTHPGCDLVIFPDNTEIIVLVYVLVIDFLLR